MNLIWTRLNPCKKKKKPLHRFFFWAIAITGLCAGLCLLTLLLLRDGDPGLGFLEDLIQGREETVQSYLSSDFREVVAAKCPNGHASACVQNLIPPDWGQLTVIRFVIGSGVHHSELYYTWWSNLSDVVAIVLLLEEENGREVVNGWRGFVLSEGEDGDAQLLRGIRRENELSAN